MINFIIPSVGRKTLKETLQSLLKQTNPNWQCWVGFDGLDKSQIDKDLLINDSRINYLYLKDRLGIFTYNAGVNANTGSAGKVRNYLIEQIDNEYEWIGFVDDDDTLRPYYIEKLLEEKNNNKFDCCIFRMIHGSIIIPPPNMNQVIQNFVGISFCVKKNFIKEKDIKFENSTCEDYTILELIHNRGGEIYMSEHITYNVKENNNEKQSFNFLKMDKNKAVYKLKGLPPIYYLNLDEQPERAEYMEGQFKYWEIEDYTRISAYDGRDGRDLGDILKGRYPDLMTSGEVGCVTSHLKALKHFLETSDSPCALIMEDDCDISTVSNWGFNWKDFFCKVPYDYDVVQLAIINPAQVHVRMHRRFVNDFSTACYLITRHHAQKLINLHVRDDKYKLDNGVKPRAVADDLIYNSGNTFSIPLFLYKIELGSSIHTEHVDVFHKSSYEGLWNFWKVDSINLTDWNTLFDYDPYFGRLPPGCENK